MTHKTDTIAICSLTALLGLTGVALFIWMASTSWVDKVGVIVGVIFISLTVFQSLLTALWWRVTAKFQHKYEVGEQAMEEMVAMPLSANGDGDQQKRAEATA